MRPLDSGLRSPNVDQLSHFSEEETETQRRSDLSWVIQQVSDKSRTRTQARALSTAARLNDLEKMESKGEPQNHFIQPLYFKEKTEAQSG